MKREKSSYLFQRPGGKESCPSVWPGTQTHVHVSIYTKRFITFGNKSHQSSVPLSLQMHSIWTTSRWHTLLIRQRWSSSSAWWNDVRSLFCCPGFKIHTHMHVIHQNIYRHLFIYALMFTFFFMGPSCFGVGGAGGGASSSTVMRKSWFVSDTVALVSPECWDSPNGWETN